MIPRYPNSRSLAPSLLLLLLSTSTTALALPPLPTNASNPFPFTNLTASPAPIRHCVADPSWSQHHHNIAPSCELALEALITDVPNYGPLRGLFTYTPTRSWATFLSSQFLPRKTISLPKRYESAQCVVVVVMVKMLESASSGLNLPGLSRGKGWPYLDEVGWGEFVEPASYVRATCGNGVGYAVLGREGGVAVVIVERGSGWDRALMAIEGGGVASA